MQGTHGASNALEEVRRLAKLRRRGPSGAKAAALPAAAPRLPPELAPPPRAPPQPTPSTSEDPLPAAMAATCAAWSPPHCDGAVASPEYVNFIR